MRRRLRLRAKNADCCNSSHTLSSQSASSREGSDSNGHHHIKQEDGKSSDNAFVSTGFTDTSQEYRSLPLGVEIAASPSELKFLRNMKDKVSSNKRAWSESSDSEAPDIDWDEKPEKKLHNHLATVRNPSADPTIPNKRGRKRKSNDDSVQAIKRHNCAEENDGSFQPKSERSLEDDRKLGMSVSKNAFDYRQRKEVAEKYRIRFLQMIDQDIVEIVEDQGGITPEGRVYKAGVRMMERIERGRKLGGLQHGDVTGKTSNLKFQQLLTEKSELQAKLNAALGRLAEIKQFVDEH